MRTAPTDICQCSHTRDAHEFVCMIDGCRCLKFELKSPTFHEKLKQRDREEHFVFILGQLFGLLAAPDIKQYLHERGLTDTELAQIRSAHELLINRFYSRNTSASPSTPPS